MILAERLMNRVVSIVFVILLFPMPLSAEIVNGEVSQVNNVSVTLNVTEHGKVLPDDHVEFFWITPDDDDIAVGTGTVSKVDSGKVQVNLLTGHGKISLGMDANITVSGSTSTTAHSISKEQTNVKAEIQHWQRQRKKSLDKFPEQKAWTGDKSSSSHYSTKEAPISNPRPGMPGSKPVMANDEAERLFKQWDFLRYKTSQKETARKALEDSARLGYIKAKVTLGELLVNEAKDEEDGNKAEEAEIVLSEAYLMGSQSDIKEQRFLAASAAYHLNELYYKKGSQFYDKERALDWSHKAFSIKELSAIQAKKMRKNFCYIYKSSFECMLKSMVDDL